MMLCILASSPDFALYSLNLYFRLGGYGSLLLPCSYFCLRDECEGDNIGAAATPVAAHIDHGHIVAMRETKIFQSYTGAGIRYNRPGTKLASIKLREFVSTMPLHEPYLVALLIALAQQQWRTLGLAMTKQVSGVTVCELLDYPRYL